MFDLIDECGKDLKCIGYKVKKLYDGKLSYASLNIDDDKKAEDFSLEKGEYHILTVPNLYDNADNLEILQKEICCCSFR